MLECLHKRLIGFDFGFIHAWVVNLKYNPKIHVSISGYKIDLFYAPNYWWLIKEVREFNKMFPTEF